MRAVRARRLTAALALVALVASACGSDDDGTSAPRSGGGGVVVATDAEPTTLDAQLTEDNGKDLATWSINEALVDFDRSGELVPLLAEDLPTIDPDDPHRWLVTLRDGISFTNGEAFDAAAVVANVERILDPDYGSTFTSELGTLSSAEAVDDLTVALVTDEPDPILPSRLRILRMVPPQAGQEDGYGENPVGTGPYVFEEWNKGSHIVLTANDDYWGDPKPTIPEVRIRFLPDVGTRMSALRAGEVDIAINTPPDEIDGLPQVLESPTPSEASAIRLNLFTEPASDPRFRQALNYAVNKEELNESLFNGVFELNHCQPSVAGTGGFNDDLDPYPYDPDKARELLAEVDLPDDFVLPFEATSAVFGRDTELAQALASYWEAVGLKVDTRLNNIDSFLELIYSPDPLVIYHETDQSSNHAARQVGLFLTGEASARGDAYPELDPLIETALTSMDDGERQAAYDEIWRISCEEAFFVFALDRIEVAGASDRIDYEPGWGKLEKMYFNRMSIEG